ncbi:MAG: hypothetical protein ACFFBV_00060 [Promethearchaeota archaeon]
MNSRHHKHIFGGVLGYPEWRQPTVFPVVRRNEDRNCITTRGLSYQPSRKWIKADFHLNVPRTME